MNNKNSKCARVRSRLGNFAAKYAGWNSQWIQEHIAQCPRCQKRLGMLGRVELAMTLLKTQPHSFDLPGRANAKALGMLKHSLRNSAKGEKLKIVRSEPGKIEIFKKYLGPISNTAACIVVLVFVKIGIFSTMNNFEQQGEKLVTQFYSEHSGEDMEST